MRLKDKIAVVTGGSRGIGQAVSELFAKEGATVIIVDLLPQGQEVADGINSGGGKAEFHSVSVTDKPAIEKLFAEVNEKHGKLDILINNAGAAWGAPVEEFPESGWDKVMDLNVKSIFFLSKGLLPALRLAGTADEPSRIVNIASVNGITHPHMDNYSYSASKAAVIQMTRHMAADLRPSHVNINAIAPGLFPSKMTKHVLAHEQEIANKLPARKIGELADVAGTAIYLCSRASNYVCGHTVVLDGGQVANAG